MKKIIIALAIFTVACAVNAAEFVWGNASYDYTDKDGADLTTGTAFLYLGTVTATANAFDFSGATLLASGGFDSTQWAYGNVDTENLSSSADLTSTTAGQAYTFILVDGNVSSLDNFDGYYTLLTGTSTEQSIPGATVTKYADFISYTPVKTSTQMSAAAVPEPTSGLLLLLGVAGLALKRKRA